MTRPVEPRLAARGRAARGRAARGRAARGLAALGLAALGLGSCGEGLPAVPLTLSKNCNALEFVSLVPAVPTAAGEQVLDIAADVAGNAVWLLVRGPGPIGEGDVLLRKVGAEGVERELLLPIPALVSPALSLETAPQANRVWVVRDEPGLFELWRVAPDDPMQPVLGSENLVSFPAEGPLCDPPCEGTGWPRSLMFMDGVPAVASLPTSSVDAGLVLWVGLLDTDRFEIRVAGEHRLNFEPPCDADTPEGETFCDEQNQNLRYPEITLLGKQDDPRQAQSVFFGHRTRTQTFGGEEFPLESADVFMISAFFDETGIPAGVLRSYSGFYYPDDGPLDGSVPPLPSASPPYGLAIDRFATYGLFSNGGVLPRLVQLPTVDPDFEELSGLVPLTVDTQLLQLDLDLALGRLVDGQWEVNKLFPDRPSESQVVRYDAGDPITEVIPAGQGLFMLRKDTASPEVVRARCPRPAASTDDADPTGS
ncbi:MAG: hypothetical protein KDK70_22310 [Myxococcales bacterium]|nr:hypothetical protein [Myxococcales bacterium]